MLGAVQTSQVTEKRASPMLRERRVAQEEVVRLLSRYIHNRHEGRV